jgi:hypothetical protein
MLLRESIGNQREFLCWSFLDPGMKGGVGVSTEDQDAIYLAIRDEIRMIARECAAFERDVVVAKRKGMEGVEPEARRHHNQDDVDIFDEINHHYHDQQQQHNPEQVHENERGNVMEELIDAELKLYRQEAPIAMKNNSGNYNNPLSWWSLNGRKFNYLTILASRILCNPETYAPSECIFSTAGLTISKDRARLASQTANEVFFCMMLFLQ